VIYVLPNLEILCRFSKETKCPNIERLQSNARHIFYQLRVDSCFKTFALIYHVRFMRMKAEKSLCISRLDCFKYVLLPRGDDLVPSTVRKFGFTIGGSRRSLGILLAHTLEWVFGLLKFGRRNCLG
jgi:hypothetical protein